MALLNLELNIEEIPENTLVPAGIYSAKIKKVEDCESNTDNGRGNYLKLELSISGPTNQGSCIFTNIIYKHDNEQAYNLGIVKLGQLARACYMSGNSIDTDLMINKEIEITVTIRKDKTGNYSDSNDVSKFAPLSNAPKRVNSPISSPASSRPIHASRPKAPEANKVADLPKRPF